MADPLHTGRSSGEPDDLTGSVQRRDAGVDRLTNDLDRLHGFDAMDDLDRVAVRFSEPNSFAATGLIDGLYARRAEQLRDRSEVVLVAHRPGKADELRIAPFSNMDVVHRISAAHIERRWGSSRTHHTEGSKKLLLGVQVRRL